MENKSDLELDLKYTPYITLNYVNQDYEDEEIELYNNSYYYKNIKECLKYINTYRNSIIIKNINKEYPYIDKCNIDYCIVIYKYKDCGYYKIVNIYKDYYKDDCESEWKDCSKINLIKDNTPKKMDLCKGDELNKTDLIDYLENL